MTTTGASPEGSTPSPGSTGSGPQQNAPTNGRPPGGDRIGRPLDEGGPESEADWTDQVTELIVDSVDKVRARTTGPVLNVAHAAVYGIVALILAIPVLVALTAGLVRFLDWLAPDVWVAYLIIAAAMWLAGAVLWSLRERGDDSG